MSDRGTTHTAEKKNTSVPYDPTLNGDERAALRDWYDQGGNWHERMSSLYRLVEQICEERLGALAATRVAPPGESRP